MKAYFHRWRSLVILALLLAPLLWPLQYFAERYYSEQLAEQNRQTLDLYVANLLGTLRRYEELPQILGGLPVLRQALQQPATRCCRRSPTRRWPTSADAPAPT